MAKRKGRSGTKASRPKKKESKELEELKTSLEAMTKERDKLEEDLAYMQAEFENLKKRSQRDVESRSFRQKECLFLDLLPVIDNLERALSTGNETDPENFAKGVRMIGAQLDQVLSDHSLKVIVTKDQGFDPFKHEAIEKTEDPDRPDGLIIEEIQKGYSLNGTVIRPSKVRVNIHPKTTEQTSFSTDNQKKEGGETNG